MLAPNNELVICFARVAHRLHERFSFLNTGIESFALRAAETLENKAGEADVLAISMTVCADHPAYRQRDVPLRRQCDRDLARQSGASGAAKSNCPTRWSELSAPAGSKELIVGRRWHRLPARNPDQQ